MNGETLTLLNPPLNAWGPEHVGAKLIFGKPETPIKAPFAVDCETDEKDGFVGVACAVSRNEVYYLTSVEEVKAVVGPDSQLIGHNLKGDLKWLRMWGANVSEKNMVYDTMLASYVVNPTKESHGLKNLALEILKWTWPTYSQMVKADVPGRKRPIKVTLDKQPVETVGAYCGMDALATFALYEHFQRRMSAEQRRILTALEMPINRILFKMEEKGVNINLSLLSSLEKEFGEKIKELVGEIHRLTEADIKGLLAKYSVQVLKEKWEQSGYKAFEKSGQLNPGSWQQKRLLLKFLGFAVESTDKRTLRELKNKHACIESLLQHSEIAKLYNGFIVAFQELPTLPTVHPTFNQVSEDSADEDSQRGLKTGRLSCQSPNIQQIPTRTDNGQKLRKLFVPRRGSTFVVADYSQIELRIAAHFSHDPILLQAFKSGEDVHEATAKALGVERFYGKTGNFLLAFGGSYKRLMDSLSIDEVKARQFFNLYWEKFKILGLWKRRMVDLARSRGGVKTLYGRWIPIQGLDNPNPFMRGKAERFAISGIVQGSAADVMKMAMIQCSENGYNPLLAVHDEFVFELKDLSLGETGPHRDMQDLEDDIRNIKWNMETVVKLDVPLEVVIGHGPSWGEAKQ